MAKIVFKKSTFIILLIFLLGIALRIHRLDRYDLWYDESIRAIDGKGLFALPPLSKLLDKDFTVKYNQDYLALYNHGFVYYWQKMFGSSEWALRFSSVIIGSTTMYFMYMLSKKLFNRSVAQISTFLLSISPLHIYYSQELSPYIIVFLFSFLSLYFFLKATVFNKKIYWLFYLIFITLGVYLHYAVCLLLFSFLCFLVINYRGFRQIIIPGLSAHAIIFILITPSLLTIISLQHYFFNFSIPFAFSEFPSWVEKITWRNVLFTVKNFSIGYNIDLRSLPGAISTIVYSILFACGLRRYPYGKKGRLLFLFLFLPVAIILLASQVKPFYVDRYFFYLLPFFLIGVAIGLSKTKKYILNGALFVVLILNFSALKNYHYNLLPSDYNQHIGIVEKLKGVTELSHFISDKFKEGDRIIHTCKKTVFPLKFYVKHYHNSFPLFAEVEKGTLAYIPGEGENLRYIDYKGTHPRLIDIENMYKPKVHPRVWLILSAFSSRKAVKENLPEYLIVELFKNNYCIEKCKEFGDVRLYLLKSCENTFNIPAAL